MTSYEIYLLIGGASGCLAFLALLSTMIDSGSIRIMAFFMLVSVATLYLADDASEDGLNVYDIPPTINKLIDGYI